MGNWQTGTRWVSWAAIVIWLSVYGTIISEAMAQARRLQRHRVLLPKPRQEKTTTAATPGVSENLVTLARRASRQAQHLMVDLVFVIDGNRDMMQEVTAIQKRIVDMAGVFEGGMVDYRFAQTSFQRLDNRPQVDVQTFSSDLVGTQEWFRELKLSLRQSGPGYGLNAIVQTLRETNFRPDASRFLLVVSKSPLQTDWPVKNAEDKIVKEILNHCKQENIQINIIGTGDRIHARLTGGSGGKWYPISKKHGHPGVKYLNASDLDKSVLTIEGVFKLTAQHVVTTVRQPVDIIFLFDSSLSMQTKVDRICGGIDEMINILDTAGLDYRFGTIRFWAETGGGQSVVVLTKPPLAGNQIKRLFRLHMPKRGDEHLLDAVMEGVPKLKTPNDRQLVLVIVTDEPTSHRAKKGYTVERAIGVCRQANAQVNVIGGSSMGSDAFRYQSGSIAFQKRIAELTNGAYYAIPGYVIADERH